MAFTITVFPEEKKITAEPGQTLLTALRSHNLAPDAPCGGSGKCGKCTVLLDGEEIRTCQYTVTVGYQNRIPPGCLPRAMARM